MIIMIRQAATLLMALAILTGIAYPLVVTVIAQVIFPIKANGSIVIVHDQRTGSELIGQLFEDPKYFWGRPSVTSPCPYNGASSSGSNLGTMNRMLIDMIQARMRILQNADPENKASIPVDLITASGSGLDPHISLAAARYQMSRVARSRDIDLMVVDRLIERPVEHRSFGVWGELVVNVLELNIALDQITSSKDETNHE